MMILWILLILAVIFIIWKQGKTYNYWRNHNIKQKDGLDQIKAFLSVIFRRESFFDMMINLYDSFPNERYFGTYQGTVPILTIKDPEIIKQVTVKEFDHFLNHKSVVPDGIDPLWSKNLFALKDIEWREMRSTLSPSFTSSKMKVIFSLMTECADDYVDYFLKQKQPIEIELKDTTTRYTNDVIATAAFGIKCDSINERDNEFYLMGKKTTVLSVLKLLLYSMAPGLSKKRRKLDDSSTEVIDTGFATVQESSIHTNSTTPIQEITDLDIAAQAMIFFFAGFDSVSVLMSFMGYELVANPDIQTRLQEEIDDTLKECKGKLTYEALLKMKYMDMVVSETLRKWPAAVITDRVCSKAFTIEPVNPSENPIHLKPGDVIFIPVNAIQRDPQYFPNPDRFDPERFNDENKGKIQPYTYMPFGLGPRNCIGSRFAILETKTIFFSMLAKFNFVTIDKTQIPIKLTKKSFNVAGESGIWIGLEARSTNETNRKM
ncbi:cytochrome p450 [Holotrichia oblita]|uniref:Cytochrome p450 n=1 Tax=Holotrichia oblita TaxID=644536 RepID=A0ACB9TB83_HOLOL|nr:cytochrome p450 [Holotrichia oblita]